MGACVIGNIRLSLPQLQECEMESEQIPLSIYRAFKYGGRFSFFLISKQKKRNFQHMSDFL